MPLLTWFRYALLLNRRSLTAKLVLIIECDVADDNQIQALFANIEKEFGHLNYLVHSIAYARKEELGGSFLDTSREGFHLAMDISGGSRSNR